MHLTRLVLVSILGLAGCGTQNSQPPRDRPALLTKVLTEFAGKTLLDYDPYQGDLVINTDMHPPARLQGELGSMKVDEVAKVEIGTILVSAPAQAAPHGLLRKVVGKRRNPDGTITLQTVQATLKEAIEHSNLRPEDVQQTRFTVPVNLVIALPQDEAVSISSEDFLQMPKYLAMEAAGTVAPLAPRGWQVGPKLHGGRCENKSQALPSGSIVQQSCIQITVWANIEINIGFSWWWFIPYPEFHGFGAWISGFSNVNNAVIWQLASLENNVGLAPPLNIKLVDFSGGPHTFWIGPIPVVITPRLFLDANLKSQLSFSVQGGLSLTSSLPNITLAIGTENNPLYFGFFCGNTVSNGYWGCRRETNVEAKIDEIGWQLQHWNPYVNPISANSSVTAGLSARTELALAAGIYLYGFIGFDGRLIPYIDPSVTASIQFSSNQANQPTTILDMNVYAGVDAKLEAGVDLLGLRLSHTLANGEIIPKKAILKGLKRVYCGANPC